MHQTYVEGLMMGEDPDDEELSADEAAESEAAWHAYLAGEDPGELLDQVRHELLGDR